MNRPGGNPKPFIFRLRIARRCNSVVDAFASTFYTPGCGVWEDDLLVMPCDWRD